MEIKPCPFCGSTFVKYDDSALAHQVRCYECGCQTAPGNVMRDEDIESEAIHVWNRRTKNKQKNKRDLISVSRFVEKNPNFLSQASIRWMIFKKEIEHCLVRLSSRIYIKESLFWEHLENKNIYPEDKA